MNPSACLLVSHGSRDPRPALAVQTLATLVAQRLKEPACSAASLASAIERAAASPLVGTAELELAPRPLHQQIAQFGARARQAGCDRLPIVPLFLLRGVHVMEDIPAEVAIAQAELGQSLPIEICPHLGSHPRIKDLLATDAIAPAARILLSHGSRRLGGNQAVAAIAAEIGALPAYWSVPPTLEAQVAKLVAAGSQQIAILPYFLFAGGITDAIAQTVVDLARQFPDTQLQLAEPLGASAAMADLAIDLLPAQT